MKNEALWAPWRMDYIRQPSEDECFLCAAFADREDQSRLILHRGLYAAVVMNRYPYNNGHLMVAPYRHVADLDAQDAVERAETADLVAAAVRVLRRAVRPDGFNIGINLGRVAGAGLETHLHTHIVPRWNGDTNFMPVLGGIKVIPQALNELWLELKPLFQEEIEN